MEIIELKSLKFGTNGIIRNYSEIQKAGKVNQELGETRE